MMPLWNTATEPSAEWGWGSPARAAWVAQRVCRCRPQAREVPVAGATVLPRFSACLPPGGWMPPLVQGEPGRVVTAVLQMPQALHGTSRSAPCRRTTIPHTGVPPSLPQNKSLWGERKVQDRRSSRAERRLSPASPPDFVAALSTARSRDAPPKNSMNVPLVDSRVKLFC